MGNQTKTRCHTLEDAISFTGLVRNGRQTRTRDMFLSVYPRLVMALPPHRLWFHRNTGARFADDTLDIFVGNDDSFLITFTETGFTIKYAESVGDKITSQTRWWTIDDSARSVPDFGLDLSDVLDLIYTLE